MDETQVVPADHLDRVTVYRGDGGGWVVELVGSTDGIGMPWRHEYRWTEVDDLDEAVRRSVTAAGFGSSPTHMDPAVTTWAEVHPGDFIAPDYVSPVGRPSDGMWRKVRSVRSAGSALVEVVCAGESPVKHRPTGEVWVMRRVDAGLSAVAS